MTLTALFLILVSAFLHASWNFLCKAHRPSLSFNVIIQATTFIMTLPFLIMMPVKFSELPPLFWGMLALSICAETVYCVGLTFAYKFGDISISYPLSRSIPVLLTALITFIFHLGKNPSHIGVIGLFVLFIGCLLLPQKSFADLHWRNFMTSALIPIILAGMGTTGYTIADSVAGNILREAAIANGASKIVATGVYFSLVQIGLSIALGAAVLIASPKDEFKTVAKERFSYMAGVFNFGAYFLVLISMGFVTNVSYVQAFRQIGLPIGVLAGVYFLHEKLALTKILGLMLIIGGLILTVL